MKKIIIILLCFIFIIFAPACEKTIESTLERYKIKYETSVGGYIEGNSEQIIIKGNKTEKVEAIVNNGYRFLGWSDGKTETIRQDVADENKSFYAMFEIDYYNLPVIKVQTENSQNITSKEKYVSCFVSLQNCENKEYEFSDSPADIRGRGNSTWYMAKKPYRIKFKTKQSILGLNGGRKFKNWVLLAEAFDFSMCRNYINFYIGSYLSVYCSDCTFVDLYVNDEYYGMYLLCEQQQINDGRIEIEEYKAGKSDPIDTGYLLENDYNYYQNEDYVIENNINGEVKKYTHWIVKSDTTTEEQLEFITEFMQKVYDVLYGDAAKETIENLIDISSAIEMTILQLINTDPDHDSSFYVFKDKGGKLQFGAPWDADMCYGIIKQTEKYDKTFLNHLIRQLYNRDWFKQLVKQRWIELSEIGIKENIINKIDYISETYEKEFEKNSTVYNPFGTKTHSNQVDSVMEYTCQKDAANYFKEWLVNRFISIDAELGVE